MRGRKDWLKEVTKKKQLRDELLKRVEEALNSQRKLVRKQ